MKFCYSKSTLDDGSLYIASPLLAVIIFYVGYEIRLPISLELSRRLRNLSKYIYFFHPVIKNGFIAHLFIRESQNGILTVYTLFMCVLICALGRGNTKLSQIINARRYYKNVGHANKEK